MQQVWVGKSLAANVHKCVLLATATIVLSVANPADDREILFPWSFGTEAITRVVAGDRAPGIRATPYL